MTSAVGLTTSREGESPLLGKVAIVTGSTGGIGRAITEALARDGADIAAVYRSRSEVDSLAAQLAPIGVRFAAIHADLTNAEDVAAIVPKTVSALGQVDILINNAAVQMVRPFMDQTTDEWDQVMAVNLRAAFVLCQQVGRQMILQGNGGRIVNMSSSSAFRAEQTPPAYTISKAGINALTRAAAGALGQHGILVNSVAPGITATPFTMSYWGEDLASSVPEGPLANLLGRVALPADIADVVVFLCLPASRNITGQTIHASAGAIV